MKKRQWIVPIFGIALMISGWLVYDTNRATINEVRTSRVEVQEISSNIETTGVIEPSSKYNVMVESGGRIAKILVKEGQKVKKGQALFQLDSSLLDLQLAQAEVALEIEEQMTAEYYRNTARQKAELAMAMAQGPGMNAEHFNDAIQQYRQAAGLTEGEAATVWNQNFDTKESSEIQEKKIRMAEMKVDSLRQQISRLTIKASMDGQVLSSNVKEGEIAAPGVPVMLIGKMQPVIIRTLIGENDISRIKPGDPAEITGDALGVERLTGKVLRIKPMANRLDSQQISEAFGETEIQLDDRQFKAVPGISVDVNIRCDYKPKAHVIPVEALTEEDGASRAYCIENGYVVGRTVKTGIRDDFFVEITQGLMPGDRVIFDPGKNIRDGVRVKTID